MNLPILADPYWRLMNPEILDTLDPPSIRSHQPPPPEISSSASEMEGENKEKFVDEAVRLSFQQEPAKFQGSQPRHGDAEDFIARYDTLEDKYFSNEHAPSNPSRITDATAGYMGNSTTQIIWKTPSTKNGTRIVQYGLRCRPLPFGPFGAPLRPCYIKSVRLDAPNNVPGSVNTGQITSEFSTWPYRCSCTINSVDENGSMSLPSNPVLVKNPSVFDEGASVIFLVLGCAMGIISFLSLFVMVCTRNGRRRRQHLSRQGTRHNNRRMNRNAGHQLHESFGIMSHGQAVLVMDGPTGQTMGNDDFQIPESSTESTRGPPTPPPAYEDLFPQQGGILSSRQLRNIRPKTNNNNRRTTTTAGSNSTSSQAAISRLISRTRRNLRGSSVASSAVPAAERATSVVPAQTAADDSAFLGPGGSRV